MIAPTSFSPESLLEELARTLERYYPSRLEIDYDALPDVRADPERVRWILWMLLLNAMRYSPARDLICLRVQLDPENTQLHFCVSDMGARIPVKYREMIFEPLSEMPKLLQRPRFGLGLGLFAARQIARRMGGDLWLQLPAPRISATTRHGNIFTLSVPLSEERRHE